MGTVAWIWLALVAGVIARLLYPGRSPVGCLLTVPVGIGGILLGTFLGTLFGWGRVRGLDPASLGLAVMGAFFLLVAYRLAFGKR